MWMRWTKYVLVRLAFASVVPAIPQTLAGHEALHSACCVRRPAALSYAAHSMPKVGSRAERPT